jgi:hypothetical protein
MKTYLLSLSVPPSLSCSSPPLAERSNPLLADTLHRFSESTNKQTNKQTNKLAMNQQPTTLPPGQLISRAAERKFSPVIHKKAKSYTK